MADTTNAARQRRYRERQRMGITWQPLTCSDCGGERRGAHGVLCVRCWNTTPEGKAAQASRKRALRARQKSRVTLCEEA
jgi:hypothetical protein